jgi:DNA-directed RNA polymerase subunit K/omega
MQRHALIVIARALEIRAGGDDVVAAEKAEVVGKLPDILIEDVVDR